MSEEKTLKKLEIIDGIEIATYSDGSQTFTPIDNKKENKEKTQFEPKGGLEKIKDWFENSTVTPYINIKNISDLPSDSEDDKGGEKSALVIGVNVKF